MKVLILNQYILNRNGSYGNYDVTYLSLYKEIPAVLKPLRFLHQILKLPAFEIWYRRDYRDFLSDFDIIILHDSPARNNNFFIKQIEKYSGENTRLFLYFWNKAYELDLLQFGKKWTITTFDYSDAKEFGLHYVGGFYPTPSVESIGSEKYDLLFVGLNKGRFEFLERLKKNLLEQNIRPLFLMVSQKYRFNKKYSAAIKYDKVLELIQKSKAILDISKKDQFGLTLRVYEAIFLGKKLVTNNKNIIRYNFYNPSSIKIIENPDDNVAVFLAEKEPVHYEEEFRRQYSLESWIARMDNGVICEDVQ